MNEILEKGNKAYQVRNYVLASECYQTYLSDYQHSSDLEVIMKLINTYWQMREYKRAESYLYQFTRIKPKVLAENDRIRIAEMYARLGNYNQAAKFLTGVPNYENKAKGYQNPDSIKKAKGDSVDWKLSILNINTDFREFSPAIAGNFFVYSSNSAASKMERAFDWDGRSYVRLWMIPFKELKFKRVSSKNLEVSVPQVGYSKLKRFSAISEGSDSRPNQKSVVSTESSRYVGTDSVQKKRIVKGFEKIKFNVSNPSFDEKGNIYFSVNRQSNEKVDSFYRIGLMEGKFLNGVVSDIKKIEWTNSKKCSEMHPTVNREGTMMIFCSDKPGGKGGFDMYYCQRSKVTDQWGFPSLLSKDINTVGNEVFPYISKDGYLYFSSDAREGFGGLDIYRTPLNEALRSGSKIEHLQYPINSSADDFGWVQDSAAWTGYFTSDRGQGDDNIFKFEYHHLPRYHHIVGSVKDKNHKHPLNSATVFLLNKQTKDVLVKKTDEAGNYLFDVMGLGDFVIKAVEEDCKDVELKVNITTNKSRDVTFQVPRTILLEKTPKDSFILEDLNYDFDKWDINESNQDPLDQLVVWLIKFPISVELRSHTDSRGSTEYNQLLSQRRAQAAVDYIVESGIDPSRIKAIGYGESRLKNDCGDGEKCSEADHRINRRTEIKIIGQAKPSNGIDPKKYKDGQQLKESDFPVGFFRK